jgi:hypothetical protein
VQLVFVEAWCAVGHPVEAVVLDGLNHFDVARDEGAVPIVPGHLLPFLVIDGRTQREVRRDDSAALV